MTCDGRTAEEAREALVARGCRHEPRMRPVVTSASTFRLGLGR
jgi:hypothetical protein